MIIDKQLLSRAALAIVGAVSLLAADATAQRGDRPMTDAEREKAALMRREAVKNGYQINEKGERKLVDNGPKPMGSMVRSSVGVTPRRVGPGGSAVVKIVLAINRDVVILPTSKIDVTYARTQGPFTLGDWQINEAKPGKFNEVYRGQPVYEDTLTISIPIQAGAKAEFKKHSVGFVVDAEFHSGLESKSIGLHRLGVRGLVEVGDPLPNPRLRRDRPRRGEAQPDGVDNAGEVRDTTPDRVSEPETIAGRELEGDAGGESRDAELERDLTEVQSSGDGGLLLLIGGGMVLLLLAAVVLRKKV